MSVHDIGIDAIASIIAVPMPLADAVANSQRLLIDASEQIMRTILVGASVAARQFEKRNPQQPVTAHSSPNVGKIDSTQPCTGALGPSIRPADGAAAYEIGVRHTPGSRI
jgi:hypothetical protein